MSNGSCHPAVDAVMIETFLQELKAAIVKIGLAGGREGFKFAEQMFREFPELKEA